MVADGHHLGVIATIRIRDHIIMTTAPPPRGPTRMRDRRMMSGPRDGVGEIPVEETGT